jgi:hypothetical protein
MNLKFWTWGQAPKPAQTQFVSKFYQMNPETDQLVTSGYGLLGGMVVLLESESVRENTKWMDTSEHVMDRALEANRWCTVSEISFHDTYVYPEGGHRYKIGQVVQFVATYEDGTQRVRKYGVTYAWLVKKNSIPVFTESV